MVVGDEEKNKKHKHKNISLEEIDLLVVLDF